MKMTSVSQGGTSQSHGVSECEREREDSRVFDLLSRLHGKRSDTSFHTNTLLRLIALDMNVNSEQCSTLLHKS